MKNRFVRVGLKVLAGAGLVVGVIAARTVLSSSDELGQADVMMEAGDVEGAIVHYRRAARWYAPGNPFCADALGKLAGIAEKAEQEADVDRALSAWRAVRSSVNAARSFYTPHSGWLNTANGRIAELMASLPPPSIDAGKSRTQLRDEHLALLTAPSRPQMLWTLVLLLGFAAWIVGAFLFAHRGFDSGDRLVKREARRWGAMLVAGFALFALGLALA